MREATMKEKKKRMVRSTQRRRKQRTTTRLAMDQRSIHGWTKVDASGACPPQRSTAGQRKCADSFLKILYWLHARWELSETERRETAYIRWLGSLKPVKKTIEPCCWQCSQRHKDHEETMLSVAEAPAASEITSSLSSHHTCRYLVAQRVMKHRIVLH